MDDWMVKVYKGEGRYLIIPLIQHFGNYSIDSEWYMDIKEGCDASILGEGILKAIDVAVNSPVSRKNRKEINETNTWKNASQYKTWKAFFKNNQCARICERKNDKINIYSTQKDNRGNYNGAIKDEYISSTATAREIGQIVMDVLLAAEAYYADKPMDDEYPIETIELANGSQLSVQQPKDRHFNQYVESNAMEIYKIYSYLPQEDAESSADFYLGMAPELDGKLESEHVRKSWESCFGKAEFFETKEVEHGIFKYRAELWNKHIHKIAYFLMQEEDVILECTMEVHQPKRRKKLDEKLEELFEEFALSCSRKINN